MVDLLNLDSAPGREQADDCWSVVSEAQRNGQEPSVSLVGSQVQCTDTKKQPGCPSLAVRFSWVNRNCWTGSSLVRVARRVPVWTRRCRCSLVLVACMVERKECFGGGSSDRFEEDKRFVIFVGLLSPQASSRHTFSCDSMLAVVLVLCAWRLCHSGESCFTYPDLRDGGVARGFDVGMEGTSQDGYNSEHVWPGHESLELSIQLGLRSGEVATLSVEIFLGDELVKSCTMSKADSSWNRCCNAQFWTHGQDVRFKYTCHYSDYYLQTCQVDVYAERNRLTTTTMTMTRTVTNTTMPEEVGMATQWHIPVTAFAGFMSCLFA
eukprot:symbB.v1.2.032707.t1/scaffold3962.1/size79057/1